MLIKCAIIFVAIISSLGVSAQLLSQVELDTCKTFESLEAALENPEKVFKLKLHRDKLAVFPEEIYQFINLQYLDLKNNSLHQFFHENELILFFQIVNPSYLAFFYLQRK